MKLTAHHLKAAVAAYFRYRQQCSVICYEAYDHGGGLADIQILAGNRKLWEVEVKTSLSDLKNDINKPKHRRLQRPDSPVERFYFAVPKSLAVKASGVVAEMYPYAGLISVNGLSDTSCEVVRNPRPLLSEKLTVKQCLDLIKQQSGTLCRLARDKAEYKNELDRRRGEVSELRKALKLADITV